MAASSSCGDDLGLYSLDFTLGCLARCLTMIEKGKCQVGYMLATCITQTVSIVVVVDGGDINAKGHYVEMYRQTKQL